MARDPYDVLGVARSATAAEIKKAFRKLAKAHHPDQAGTKGKDAGKDAGNRFAEANQAYEILGDEAKRARFDRGEIDAEGKPRFRGFEGAGAGGFPGGGFASGSGFGGAKRTFEFGFGPGGPFARRGGVDPADLFGEAFGEGVRGARGRAGAGGPPAGEDVAATLELSLEDAVAGGPKRLSIDGREVEVTIPPGVAEGAVIRLKGQGGASPFGGPPGDLRLTVKLAPHPRYEVRGQDLRLRLPVALEDAVLGGPVRVETPTGPVEVTLPPMTSSGRQLRLRGRGLKGREGAGDLVATVEIALPREPDDALAALMRGRRAAREDSREG